MKILFSGNEGGFDFIDTIKEAKPDIVFLLDNDRNLETKKQICFQNKVEYKIIPTDGYHIFEI